MAERTKEVLDLFKGAQHVFRVPDIQRIVTEVKGFSNLARGLRANVERIRSDLEVNVSIKSHGEIQRKYNAPGQAASSGLKDEKDKKNDKVAANTTPSPTPGTTPASAGTNTEPGQKSGADLKDEKDKKNDQVAANTAPSPTPGTTPASAGTNTEVNPTNVASTSATGPDAGRTTAEVPSETGKDSTGDASEAVPPEMGKDSTVSGTEADGWICAACAFRNNPTVDACEKCATSRRAFETMKTQLEEMKQKTDLVQPPSNWLPVDPGTRAKRVKLEETDEKYLKINKIMAGHRMASPFFSFANFMSLFGSSGGSHFQIKKIERIENLHLYQLYCIKKSQLVEEECGKVMRSEHMLWHGTDSACIDNIASYGFNRSLCGKNGTAFGKGVYFSAAPCYSSFFATPDASGIQHMFYCRVLTGRFTEGNEKMVEPPMLLNNLGRYNSLVNSVKYPGIFVIFHDAQAYPEFLVTFTRKS